MIIVIELCSISNRAVAHRILIPAFGPLSIRGMFDGMLDVATQLINKACTTPSPTLSGIALNESDRVVVGEIRR